MRLTPETFQQHLSWIKEAFEPVSLGDWLSANVRPAKKPYCAITFDDGWADNYTYALPLLRRAGLSATVFLVADYIGTKRDFWPGRLQRILASDMESIDAKDWAWLNPFRPESTDPDRPPRPAESDSLITELKRLDDEAIELRLTAMETAMALKPPQEATMLNWKQVREMTSDGTFSVGSHTCNHRRLGGDRPHDSLQNEILGSKSVITRHTGHAPEIFCYPNGDVSPAAEEQVRDHYQAACVVRRGWNKPADDPFNLKRLGMHEDVSQQRSQFLARCFGVG